MSTTTDLNTLVINYLTEAQYEAAVSGGTIDPDQLYLTPETNVPVTDVEVDGSSVVSGGVAEITLPTVPTKVSDLTNDSGYITSSALPTKVSDLTNDSGYLTSYTETGNVEFDTSASTGTTDGDLYALLVDLGWTDCIV